ncbi:type III-B CRISPR-associated protein Cas10/Cmr2 [Cyanobacteria bacterium FACHB-DQ100]|nr:type III-B CRISPR-associated protein Cas10/Cmr2 [Cyanobacteria bacterium FACHB-DQ100]
MVNQDLTESLTDLSIGIAWCLAWGDQREPQFDITVLREMRQALKDKRHNDIPRDVKSLIQQVKDFQLIPKNYFPSTLKQLKDDYSELWNQKTQIGLVYGGATKIKQYVFEASKLPDIRGASALLDRINLVDLPAFFGKEKSINVERWLDKPENFPGLRQALIPELVIYSTGGNILAFCPAAYVNALANAIEKRYTHETLTANSCAVGETFRLLEVKFGLLNAQIEQTFWLDQYLVNQDNPIVQAYFDQAEVIEPQEKFWNRKNFTELVTQLTARYNQRRSGNNFLNRPSRCYPPMFETHPYLRRDESDLRLAVAKAQLAGEPHLSDALARKKIMGQRAKSEESARRKWYSTLEFGWQDGQAKKLWRTGPFQSWGFRFERFLRETGKAHGYYRNLTEQQVTGARTLREIGNVSRTKGFVAYIYADGNNMGGYIQKSVHAPEDHQKFSKDVFEAVGQSVFQALSQQNPRQLQGLNDADNIHRNNNWIHPFEIVTIGGDDVLLIVPADQALSIAKTIGENFEAHLSAIQSEEGSFIYRSDKTYNPENAHRYHSPEESSNPTGENQCKLSMSIGVLITAENTPIYYAENLVSQLLKSAKKRAKDLRNEERYLGGTIDFLILKSVTMLSDKIETFRQEGLTKEIKIQERTQILKQYAGPYTLHEIGGLVDTVKALKKADFPRSQLYQIRILLDRGKQTAILNYRYFRTRLKTESNQRILEQEFEKPWCSAKTNGGNIAPWMSYQTDQGTTGYETIWRDLVDLYAFVDELDRGDRPVATSSNTAEVKP